MRGWFGPFRIERQVGRGGLGAVYRAVDSRSGETVAVKTLPGGVDPHAAQRLRREFDALRHLRHPNIVRALDMGEESGLPWLEMEFVDGLALRDWLTVATAPEPLEPDHVGDAPEGVDLDVLFEEPDSGALLAAARARRASGPDDPWEPVPLAEQRELCAPARISALCEALAQVADGLAFIHSRGLVHRDLKPSNILVTPARRAILVDFGLAKRFSDDQITDHGRVVGTWRYMSPEQARGEPLDLRADLYGLGATLYELVAGRPAFPQHGQWDVIEAVVTRPPPRLAEINPSAPPALAALAGQLLEKRAEDRPHDAVQVALLLRAVAGGFAAHA